MAPPHARVDLQNSVAVRSSFKRLGDASALVFCAYVEGESMEATVAPNVKMLANAIDGLIEAGAPLRHVVLICGGKSYGEHLGPYKTPAKERDPRFMGPIFYNNQEDLLWERATRYGFTWTVLRPDAVWGPSIGSPMNLLLGIATFAAISKELRVPLRFPGSLSTWNALYQVTDAGLLAEAVEWALESDAAKGEIFNVTNGDLFRWEHVWPAIAANFGMETASPQPMNLIEQMRCKAGLWQQIVERHGLIPAPWERLVAWPFTNACLNMGFDLMQSTIKIRQAGFHSCLDSHDAIVASLNSLRTYKIIP
jgi:nucleoside-diphosphate-sugar epimerase